MNRFERALARADGAVGAHCVHELWMRGEMSINIERALASLWARAAASVPEWLPMRYIEWLPRAYEIALGFHAGGKGRSNIYLVLLDYRDRDDMYGVYVGMSKYSPAQRFDQHKAGIRAAGSVLKRGSRGIDRSPTFTFAIYQALGGCSNRGGAGAGAGLGRAVGQGRALT